MSQSSHSSKFERVFEQIDDIKERVAKVEAFESFEKEQLDTVVAKLDEVKTTLNQIIGKEAVRSTIAGIIGAGVSGVIVWLVSLMKTGG